MEREEDHDAKVYVERELSHDDLERLNDSANVLSSFKRDQLEREAKKNWDLFYKRNSTNFFKDRHWIGREFEELAGVGEKSETIVTKQKIMLELGCGVGNTVFPILEENPNLYVYCCDFSPRAVNFVKENTSYDEKRCCAFQCDITQDPLSNIVKEVDIATMFFVLSAICPEKMPAALANTLKVIKEGGVLLFRDYGIFDHAMLRFGRGHKLADNFYVRQDGTRAYYFSLDFARALFEGQGFQVEDLHYVQKKTENKKEGLSVPRVFIQGKFRRPVL